MAETAALLVIPWLMPTLRDVIIIASAAMMLLAIE
jgi:hypothetical protein